MVKKPPSRVELCEHPSILLRNGCQDGVRHAIARTFTGHRKTVQGEQALCTGAISLEAKGW